MQSSDTTGKPDDLNTRTLSRTLKYLERMGIVQREVVGTQPFSVVYHLAEKGIDMADILAAYRRWGEKWTVPAVQAMKTVSAKNTDIDNRQPSGRCSKGFIMPAGPYHHLLPLALSHRGRVSSAN